MPTYRIHIIGGLASFGACYQVLQTWAPTLPLTWHHWATFGALAVLGSIFPDIDVKSNMQKIFYGCMVLALPVAYYVNFKAFMILAILSGTFLILRHRGITHQAWFLIAMPLALGGYLVSQHAHQAELIFPGCLFFSVGGLSHILLDRISAHFSRKKR